MIHMFTYWGMSIKVNSVQEPCAKCFVVHILKFEILKQDCRYYDPKARNGWKKSSSPLDPVRKDFEFTAE